MHHHSLDFSGYLPMLRGSTLGASLATPAPGGRTVLAYLPLRQVLAGIAYVPEIPIQKV
jgi:hypothetical protein